MAEEMIKHRLEVVAGLAPTGTHVKVSDDTFTSQNEIMTMNEQLVEAIEATGSELRRWNSIRIYKITSRMDILDSMSLGCIVNITVGRN